MALLEAGPMGSTRRRCPWPSPHETLPERRAQIRCSGRSTRRDALQAVGLTWSRRSGTLSEIFGKLGSQTDGTNSAVGTQWRPSIG